VSTIINLDSHQRDKLSHTLGQYLSKTSLGKKIISRFQGNNDEGAEALLDYLDKTLPENRNLTKQIADILGEEHGQQFITTVNTGGSVGEIINVGQLGELTIRYYVFSDVRQVITLLLGLVVIGGIIAFGTWSSQQPRIMTGDFNIAVAEFSQLGEADTRVAPIISQQVFRFLDDQAKLITFEDVQVSHKNIGVITSAEEAKALSKRIHAQVIIYGDVTSLGNQVRFTPQFYVAEAFRSDVSELNGQQKLAAPITFSIESILTTTPDPLDLIQERTVIMMEFTKALVYLATDNFLLAQEAIDQAIMHSEPQGPFEGQEVLYLFGSEITRLRGDKELAQRFVDEALKLNPNYGRGFIAQANIYYDQGNLYKAIMYYTKAKQLPNQPFGAYIVEKASLNIGNSCWVQLQYVLQKGGTGQSGSDNLELCALDNYQQVINAFTSQDNPETILKEMAAWAYYGVGTIDQQRDLAQDAKTMYEQALEITTDQELIQRIDAGLKEVK
jgi:tetratricopeptide (TPR) repeat protein